MSYLCVNTGIEINFFNHKQKENRCYDGKGAQIKKKFTYLDGIQNFYFSSYFDGLLFFELTMTRVSGNIPDDFLCRQGSYGLQVKLGYSKTCSG